MKINSANDSKNNPNTHTNRLNLKVKLLLLLCLILLIVLIYYIEKLLFNILNLVCFFLFPAIFLFTILHLLFIRTIVMILIFPGKNYLFKTMMKHENGKMNANRLMIVLTSFKKHLESLKSSSLDIIKASGMRTSNIFNVKK